MSRPFPVMNKLEIKTQRKVKAMATKSFWNTGSSAMLAACLLVAATRNAGASSVINSFHDLSFGSTSGGIKTSDSAQTKVCVYCHTPHRANQNVPLWNKVQTTQTFTFYQSNYLNTYLAVAPPVAGGVGPMPKGQSRLCLSCHDGVTAIGSVSNLNAQSHTIPTPGMPAARNLGTDLTGDHPIKYAVNTAVDQQILVPTAPVKIYDPTTGRPTSANGGLVECTSCHNPHDNQNGDFLVMSNDNAALCKKCHNMGPGNFNSQGIHDTVGTVIPSMNNKTMASLSCMGCHTPHGANTAGGQRYLLRGHEEDTCYACHDGSVLSTSGRSIDIKSSFQKAFNHPVAQDSTGVHLNPELNGAQYSSANSHSECQDCHNPHEAQQTTAAEIGNNLAPGALRGVSGVEPDYTGVPKNTPISNPSSFTYVARITKEYQLCLKCHSNALGANPPSGTTDRTRDFNPLNDSYHPVMQNKATNIYCSEVTMLAPWRTAGGNHKMKCSDCHRDNSAAGNAPRGPHGSGISRILWDNPNPVLSDGGGVAAGRYVNPICLKCHDPKVYSLIVAEGGVVTGSRFTPFSSKSPFAPGNQHVSNSHHRFEMGCTACHGNPDTLTDFHGECMDRPSSPLVVAYTNTVCGNKCWSDTGCGVENQGAVAAGYAEASSAYHFLNNRTNLLGWADGPTGYDQLGANYLAPKTGHCFKGGEIPNPCPTGNVGAGCHIPAGYSY